MTRDEILNMEAGREMDALIAVLFFGWRWQNGYITLCRLLAPPEGDKRWTFATRWDDNGIPDYLEHFTEDIAAAWQVVEKFGIAIIPQSAEGGFNWLAMDLDKVVYSGDVTIVEKNGSAVSAPTAPLAICRAALLAVMELDE